MFVFKVFFFDMLLAKGASFLFFFRTFITTYMYIRAWE